MTRTARVALSLYAWIAALSILWIAFWIPRNEPDLFALWWSYPYIITSIIVTASAMLGALATTVSLFKKW